MCRIDRRLGGANLQLDLVLDGPKQLYEGLNIVPFATDGALKGALSAAAVSCSGSTVDGKSSCALLVAATNLEAFCFDMLLSCTLFDNMKPRLDGGPATWGASSYCSAASVVALRSDVCGLATIVVGDVGSAVIGTTGTAVLGTIALQLEACGAHWSCGWEVGISVLRSDCSTTGAGCLPQSFFFLCFFLLCRILLASMVRDILKSPVLARVPSGDDPADPHPPHANTTHPTSKRNATTVQRRAIFSEKQPETSTVVPSMARRLSPPRRDGCPLHGETVVPSMARR